MSDAGSYLAQHRQRKPSRSAKVKSGLSYPVIDTDLHTNEFSPLLEDYVDKVGGPKAVDEFRTALGRGFRLGAHDWYALSAEERRAKRVARPPWWGRASKNTLDLATVGIPSLLAERLQDSGTDFAVLYPNVTTFSVLVGKEELRRILVRAVNIYHADVYRPYASQLAPVPAIPLHTPQEGIEELEYAVKTLGLKAILIPGAIRRPIPDVAARYPTEHHSAVAQHSTWLDTFGIDSAYEYDPFWAKVVELGVAPTTHSGGMGWTSRSSISNYVYNHIGHFASASEALAKSLFLGGVTRRFPKLRVGFLEGGAGWGAQLYADLVGHWEKRGAEQIQNYNPAFLDEGLLVKLFDEYAGELYRGKRYDRDGIVAAAVEGSVAFARKPQDPDTIDEFAAAGIERIEDIRDRYVPNFFFGSEADDPTVAYAFNTKVNPLEVKLNAFWASDSGHWDVPDLTEVLAQTWDLVERGALAEEDFQALVSTNPYRFYTDANPDFFKGTVVEAKLDRRKAA
jgi:predicted TIM-barrel fold metal-dependent hydrolase